MRYLNKRVFENFYKKYTEKNLKQMLDLVYNSLSFQFKNKPRLSEEGYKEFLCAILLFKYDKLMEKMITIAMCKLFEEKVNYEDFYENMEIIIELSNISFDEWISLYDYIYTHHKWIENYKAV